MGMLLSDKVTAEGGGFFFGFFLNTRTDHNKTANNDSEGGMRSKSEYT